jgi:hypothetical protein
MDDVEESGTMRPPFPGMDPWLEHPAIWADVHNSLITSISDELVPRVAPRYYIGIKQRVYTGAPGEFESVGLLDVAVGKYGSVDPSREPAATEQAAVGVLDVEVPSEDQLEEWYLEIHEVEKGTLVTSLEILSPYNKIHEKGRQQYLKKRRRVLGSMTNLVEIDLLRAGEPMPLERKPPHSDYRILVRRGANHPKAKLFVFGVRQSIPVIPIPLLPEDDAPLLDLGAVLHQLYDRARYDLRLKYAKPPVPPLADETMAWARAIAELVPPN